MAKPWVVVDVASKEQRKLEEEDDEEEVKRL
jgi:hypothetical protein